MRIALAQINPAVGDIAGNRGLIEEYIRLARGAGAAVVVFPELAVSGYPPEDLLLKEHFVEECGEALHHIGEETDGIVVIAGAPLYEAGACYNAAAVIADGEVRGWYRKIWLPNYGVFDEKRYFAPGEEVVVTEVGGVKLAITICEDIWDANGPGEVAARDGGAAAVLNLSMSPYHRGRGAERAAMLAERAASAKAHVVYVNGVGGQDELVFDGQSMVFDSRGRLVARGAQFQEELLFVDLEEASSSSAGASLKRMDAGALWPVRHLLATRDADHNAAPERHVAPTVRKPLDPSAELYEALCLGVRDYVTKNGFDRVVIGVSGGIDSAVTACVAKDALGAEKVSLVSMPSRFSSSGTKSDAAEVASRLGATFLEIPIEVLFCEYLACLDEYLDKDAPGVTEQNIQARIRGNLLMALSNKFGWLVLTTGNKSEMAVGYATLYGDMAGGYAVLKDVPKTLVYELAEYRNRLGHGEGPIPASTLSRAPSAELAPNQKDQDSLPPYEILDRVIEEYVVNDASISEMVEGGLQEDVVRRVIGMIDGNEYKRRQSAPGVRITPKAFGKDRRLPMTNRYRG